MRQQKLGHHSGPAGMCSGEGVCVHSHAVQKTRRHLPGSSAFYQPLDPGYCHHVKNEGCWEKDNISSSHSHSVISRCTFSTRQTKINVGTMHLQIDPSASYSKSKLIKTNVHFIISSTSNHISIIF